MLVPAERHDSLATALAHLTINPQTPCRNLVLPLEIVDRVVSYLEDDKGALLTCAIACREWLASCRPYLFHTVTFRSEDRCRQFCDLLESSPIIREYVRALHLIQPYQDGMDPEYRPWVTDNFVPTFPTLLRQVESLECDSVNEAWSVKSLHHLSNFSAISTLSLFRFGSSVPELCAFISAFPHLEQCIIRSFRDLGTGTLGFRDCLHPPGPRLKLLHIKSYSFPLGENNFEMGFLVWILGTESRTTLQDVAITGQTSDIEMIGELLRAVGPQLERLEIICQELGGSRLPEDDQRMYPSLNIRVFFLPLTC